MMISRLQTNYQSNWKISTWLQQIKIQQCQNRIFNHKKTLKILTSLFNSMIKTKINLTKPVLNTISIKQMFQMKISKSQSVMNPKRMQLRKYKKCEFHKPNPILKRSNLLKYLQRMTPFTLIFRINNSTQTKIKQKLLPFPWTFTNRNGSKTKPYAKPESNNFLQKNQPNLSPKSENCDYLTLHFVYQIFLFFMAFFSLSSSFWNQSFKSQQQHFLQTQLSCKQQRFRILQKFMESIEETDLITLKIAKENQKLETIKPRLTSYPKYFFNQKENLLIIYDNTSLYVIGKDQMKNFNLGKQFLISQIAYHSERDIIIFLTAEGQLYVQFLNIKTLIILKKEVKKPIIFDWVYGVSNIFHCFIADQKGFILYKVDDQKKSFKQVKSLSGKYNSFLYEPLTQTLVGFPLGDCKNIQPFNFHNSKYSNWFKLAPVPINFMNDEALVDKAKEDKSLGFDWGKNNQDIFSKKENETHYVNLIKVNKKCYLIFFFAEQGLLKMFSIFDEKEKEVIQKLPSDSIPDFNIVDNMLVVHLKIEGITFIYDMNGNTLQPLVSPYPLRHKENSEIKKVYEYVFIGQRAIHPKGFISKCEIQLNVIFNYLKNESQIFDFLNKRRQAKMEILTWLRRKLLKIKELNLSKFWKSLFVKFLSNAYPQNQVINLVDLFSNVFYTLSQEELIPKEKLLNIILECIRQAFELKMPIPPMLQNLVFDLLMEYRRYEILVYLLHNDVIKDSQQIAKKVYQEYFKTHDIILGTLAVDITFRSGNCKDMLKILMKLERVRDAKKWIKQYYDKIQVLYLIDVAKYLKNPVVLEDYLKFIKSFILLKYPTINPAYLQEAEQKIFSSKNPKLQKEESTLQEQKISVNLLSEFQT